MIYEFIGPEGKTIRITDPEEAQELLHAIGAAGYDVFDPSENGDAFEEDLREARKFDAWSF